MKRYRKSWKQIISFIMAAIFLCSCTGVLAYAAGTQNKGDSKEAITKTTNGMKAAGNRKPENQNNSKRTNAKDETVYVIANTDGSTQKVIVSDWIKNVLEDSRVIDSTLLSNITNVKDDAKYSMNTDNSPVWESKGGDIYYQGDTDKAVPVTIAITYLLDGKKVTAKELAGKSGNVTIRFDYTNNQSEHIKIDGVETKIYVPFVMLSGMVLENDQFSNVTVTNGKIINDGDRTLVIGAALPGMQENLNIDKETFDIPSFVEINADVTDFELTTTLTLATNEVFSDINLDRYEGIDELEKLPNSMDDLTDAMNKLMDGSSTLYDGLSVLLEKSGELTEGINRLEAGAQQLNEGTGSLSRGAAKLHSGIGTLSSGLDTLTENNTSLNNGAKQVFETLLSTANSQLSTSGLQVQKLTINNYGKVLDGVIKSLDKTTVYSMAYQKAQDMVTAKVREQEKIIRERVEEAARGKVLEEVLKAAGQKLTADEYQAAVKAGQVPDPVQAQVKAVVEAQMNTDTVRSQINSNTEAQIQNLISLTMKSSDVTAKINAAVESAKSGAERIIALREQLDHYNQFYQGLLTYTDGVAQADTGAKALYSGSKTLTEGITTLSDGTESLSGGIKDLKKGGSALIKGVSKLKNGSGELSDGMTVFNKDGIQKLTDAVKENLDGIVARLRATIDASKHYKSFAGKSDNMDGTVKFIYRTASIEKSEDNEK